MENKQIKVSVKCWEMLQKLAKQQRRSMGNTVEILTEDALRAVELMEEETQ